ncbi:hypothetical protein ACH4VR_28985 [Streptomyces sp. NPDC020883]|uniref:hypothetical protein n=1 Tax=Streptomyces sp. NPDC020883 TaxID=3365099 RepID=UPI0037A6CE5A
MAGAVMPLDHSKSNKEEFRAVFLPAFQVALKGGSALARQWLVAHLSCANATRRSVEGTGSLLPQQRIERSSRG